MGWDHRSHGVPPWGVDITGVVFDFDTMRVSGFSLVTGRIGAIVAPADLPLRRDSAAL